VQELPVPKSGGKGGHGMRQSWSWLLTVIWPQNKPLINSLADPLRRWKQQPSAAGRLVKELHPSKEQRCARTAKNKKW
jgi:hypothetical protein